MNDARHGPLLWAATAAALLGVGLLLLPPVGTDLAAQLARAHFAVAHPLTPVDLSWYGGVHPWGYSVLGPLAAGLVGVRLAGVLAAVAAACLLALVLVRAGAPRPRLAACWGAVVLVLDVVSGRTTFALALVPAVGALLLLVDPAALRRRRAVGVAALAALAVLVSPVVAVFFLAIAAGLLATRRVRAAAALVVGGAVPLGVVALLFADPSRMPFTWAVTWPPLVVAGLVLVLVPARWRVIRVTALAYAVGVLVTWLVPSPLGSNVERLALLFGGPVLAGWGRVPVPLTGRGRTVATAALVAALGWTAWWQAQPAYRDLSHLPDPPHRAAFHAGLLAALQRLGGGRVRVEVVPERNHWESVAIGEHIPLARGWERQVDVQRNRLFYAGPLIADRYRRWLDDHAVAYVALSDAVPDWAARSEARLVGSGTVPGLTQVWADAHWRVWRVDGSPPLAGPPAQVVAASPTALRLEVPSPAVVRLRLAWSRWLVASGGARLRRDGDATDLVVTRAGPVTVTSRI